MPVIATGLDYSARRLTGAQVRKAGYAFVNRYLWFPGQRWPALTDAERRDMESNDVQVNAVYEQDTSDPAGGWNAGVAMARQAVQSAQAVGLPTGATIFMCADGWLASRGIRVATAMAFLDGARSILRFAGYLTGAYGFADFVYAAQDGGHADVFWLCGAESGVRPGIHMYQWNNGRVYVDDLECDLNKQYLPLGGRAPGGGGIEGDDVGFNDPVTNHNGVTFTAGQWLTWGNEYAAQGAANSAASLAKLDALTAAVAAIANDQDLTPDEMRAIVDAAVRANADAQAQLIAAKTVTVLREAIREELGDDNAEQADAIVDRLAERLRASLTADVENGPTEDDTVR